MFHPPSDDGLSVMGWFQGSSRTSFGVSGIALKLARPSSIGKWKFVGEMSFMETYA